jgi:hypothetical protein
LEDFERIQTGKAGKRGAKISISLKNAQDDSEHRIWKAREPDIEVRSHINNLQVRD